MFLAVRMNETTKVVGFVVFMLVANVLYLVPDVENVRSGLILSAINPLLLGTYLGWALSRPEEKKFANFLRMGVTVGTIAAMVLIYQWRDFGTGHAPMIATQWRRTILFGMHLLVAFGILVWWKNRVGYSRAFDCWIIAAATLQVYTFVEFQFNFGMPEPSALDQVASVAARATGFRDWVLAVAIPVYLLVGTIAGWRARKYE